MAANLQSPRKKQQQQGLEWLDRDLNWCLQIINAWSWFTCDSVHLLSSNKCHPIYKLFSGHAANSHVWPTVHRSFSKVREVSSWPENHWACPTWQLERTARGMVSQKLNLAQLNAVHNDCGMKVSQTGLCWGNHEENFTSNYPEEEFPSSPFIGEIVWKHVIVQFFFGGQKQKLWIWMHLAGQMDCHLLHADVARLWGQGFRSQTSWWRHRTPCQSKTFDARFCVSCPFPKSVKVISQKGIDINIRDKYTLQICI